ARTMDHPEGLLQAAQHRVTLAENRREMGVQVTACLQRSERSLRIGGTDTRIGAMFHLEPLDRELDVDQASPAELHVVAGRPLLGELALHPHPDMVDARR